MKTQNIKTAKTRKLAKQILFSAVVFLFSMKSFAADYYWVAGSGSWDDFSNHWATTSGGTTFHTAMPNFPDDVYFDANSFLTPSDTVTIPGSSGSLACGDFNCTNITNNPYFSFQAYISVYGDVLLSPNMSFAYPAFQFANNFNIDFDPAGHPFSSIDFYGGGIINLLNDLTCAGGFGMHFFRGGMITNNHTLTINNDFSTSGQLDDLSFDFGTSTINCSTFFCHSSTSSPTIIVSGNATVNASVNFYVSAGDYNRVTTPNFGAENWNSPTGHYNTIISKDIGCFDCIIDSAITSYFNSGTGFGASVNKLIITYDNTVANSPNIDGKNIIGSATISGAQCNISGNTPFDSLSFYNSPGLIIAEGDTVVVNNYFFKDNSQPLFNLRSSNVSLPAFFRSPLNLCLDSMKIENIQASGNIPFHAGANSVDLGGNTGWSFTNCAILAGYYWVGGTGNWSDFANHWATTSGGTTFHTQAPIPTDDVFFDANSFTSSNQTVNLDIATAYCNNFDWQNTFTASDLITANVNNKISVFGSFNVTPKLTFNGIFSFESTNSGNTIFIPDTLHCTLDFNNQLGTWIFNSPIAIKGSILIHGGTVNTNNYDVSVHNFISNYGTTGRTLLPGTSTFTITCFEQFLASPIYTWSLDNGIIFNGVNTDLNFLVPQNADTLNFSIPYFSFENTNTTYYKNISCKGALINGSFIASVDFIGVSNVLIRAQSFKIDYVHIYNINVGDFAVDSVIIDNTWSFTSSSIIGAVNVNYFKCKGDGNLYLHNASSFNEFILYGNLMLSGGLAAHFFGDVYISGNFTKNSPPPFPDFFRKLVIGGDATINGNCIVDTLMLTAGKNYSFSSGDSITINNQFIAFGSAANYIQLHSTNVGSQSNFQFTQGNVCSDFLMIKDINASGTNISAGANSFDLGNNTGWLFSACTPQLSDVWPGDANYDLTANNVDVLNIGLAYGETGPARAGASNAWVAQPATDWSSFFQSAINKKHADCDGNGMVDNNDTLAISLNYGLTHPARLANPNSDLSISSPQLYLIANPDTVMEGDTVEVDIYLGTQSIPVDSIYGIAFTINFDTALVDTSWMPFDFTGSWMGTPGVDLLPFDHKVFSEGKADVALTRTDHSNIGGYGYLGKMGAVIVDNVGTRLTTAPPYVTLPLSVSNVTALTATEFYLTISSGTENVEIDTSGITGIHQPLNDAPFSIYPNPVHNKLNVFSYWLKDKTNCTVELYNVMGEKIISKQVAVSQNRFSVDVSTVPQDMYFIKVITAKGTVNKKILVVKK